MEQNRVQKTAGDMAAWQAEREEIDLVEVFFALLHSWRAMIPAVVIGAVLMAGVHMLFVEPSYRATAQLYITNTDSMISLQDLQIGSALTEDYQNIIKSRSVLNKVIKDLQLDTDYRQLERLVDVSNPTGTHIIRIGVTTSELELSRDIANDLLNISIDSIYQIVGSSQPTVIDYSEAEAVEEVTPGLMKFIAIGAMAGMLIVTAFVVLRMLMDNTFKSDDDVNRYLQLPVLAAVPYYKK